MSVFFSDFPMSSKVMDYVVIGKDVTLGENTVINSFCNLYGCSLGDDCMVGTFTEIQRGVIIGNGVRIQSHSFIASGAEIGDNVFLSHHTCTINDEFKNHKVNFTSDSWGKLKIEDGVIVGSGCVLFPVTIKKGAIIAAGSVLRNDVGENEIWGGSPAKFIKMKS